MERKSSFSDRLSMEKFAWQTIVNEFNDRKGTGNLTPPILWQYFNGEEQLNLSKIVSEKGLSVEDALLLVKALVDWKIPQTLTNEKLKEGLQDTIATQLKRSEYNPQTGVKVTKCTIKEYAALHGIKDLGELAKFLCCCIEKEYYDAHKEGLGVYQKGLDGKLYTPESVQRSSWCTFQ